MRHRLGIVILAAATTAGGCMVNQDDPPALTGPSGLAQSINVTANPDTLLLGQKSTVVIEARDASGGPLPNLRLFLDIKVGAVSAPCGRLSLGEVTTASDGRTAVEFVAPTPPLPMPECSGLAGTEGQVTITAASVGTNFQTQPTFGSWGANIRLLASGASAAPRADVFTVSFTMTPIAGVRNYQFNGTSSVSPGHTITTYAWTFGDGETESGPSVDHDFAAAGTYLVTLTVTDEIGQSGSKSALLTVN